jgi:hypothetical protein
LQRGDQGGVCSVTRTGKTYTDFLHILLTTTNSETGQPLGDQEIRGIFSLCPTKVHFKNTYC